jgi:lysyl endopeptidase
VPGLKTDMKITLVKWIRLAAAAVLAAAAPAMAQMPAINGEPALAPKALLVQPQLRLAPQGASKVQLSPIADSELATLRQANQRTQKRLTIGVVRPIDTVAPPPGARDFSWTAVPGGSAAQVAVTSPEAGALRLGIDLAGVPEDVEMVFFGSDTPERLLGPVRVGDIADRTAAWWSPLTDGATQTVEFFVPGTRDASALSLRITSASHVFTTIASRFEKRVTEIGDAGSCNVDIKCSALQSSQAFLNVRNSVAQMVFNDGNFIGLCTGQLLNDADSSTQTPWFYSANHCFDNESLPLKTAAQLQSVASSLNTLWFFEAVSCNSTAVPPYSQLIDGAAYIYNNPGADSLFLRLNGTPPAGAFFAGWDANPVPVGSAIIVIHHPSGDLKKVSQGSVVQYSSPQPSLPGGATTLFSEVKYSSGTTEQGSSGSGLFTFNGTQYVLRGALYGGGAFCTSPNDSDWYSQFDKVYSALAPYLGAAAPIDYSDLWWDPTESGWGLNIIQHASRNIFAVWYTYGNDSRPMWFTVPGGTWTTPTTFTGSVYSTSGPAANNPSFDHSLVVVNQVGTATITFSDASNGTWAYTINGVSGTKTITRQLY